MTKTLEAVFDGKVFHPNETIELAPNTRVRLTVETADETGKKQESFLQAARSLNLEGPSDWSVRLDAYLYGNAEQRDE
jgi:Protein of unknown function DUF104